MSSQNSHLREEVLRIQNHVNGMQKSRSLHALVIHRSFPMILSVLLTKTFLVRNKTQNAVAPKYGQHVTEQYFIQIEKFFVS